MSGRQILHHQSISLWVIPSDLREMVPESLLLRQPIDELEQMITPDNQGLSFTHPAFPPLAMLWTQRLRAEPAVERIYFVVAAAQISGIVGQVRTALVEMVADLTANTPIDQLPDRRKVDNLVQNYMYGPSEHNEIIVHGDNTGVIGAGQSSQRSIHTTGLPESVSEMFDALREHINAVVDVDSRASLEQAVDDFHDSVTATTPDADNVRRRGRLLNHLATIAGTAALTTAANDLVTAAIAATGMG